MPLLSTYRSSVQYKWNEKVVCMCIAILNMLGKGIANSTKDFSFFKLIYHNYYIINISNKTNRSLTA